MNINIIQNYQHDSLVDLIKLIVSGNAKALDEFHSNRPIFIGINGSRLLFVQYVNWLKSKKEHEGEIPQKTVELLESAYDITISKFTCLPNAMKKVASNQKKIIKQKDKGTDCRFYFNAFLKYFLDHKNRCSALSSIEEEILAAKLLTMFVRRHFYLSFLEALRRMDLLYSRYEWSVNGGRVRLRLPRSLHYRERRRWLEKHVGNPVMFTPEDKKIIQNKIERLLPKESFVSLDYDIKDSYSVCTWDSVDNDFNGLLAKVISHEKADNIDQQRPAIRALGAEILIKMILRIFQDIFEDDYVPSEIAKTYGVSESTLSRFAGPDWRVPNIPDLWRNTASILSRNSEFMEIAEEVGIRQHLLKRCCNMGSVTS